MILRQYHLACLSIYSYLIGDETSGRAVVVDPQRDISQYLADARELGLRIERVVETHFHADFLSGHLELAAATGAVVSYGSVARPNFEIDALDHGERLCLGEVELEVLHTPGHTPESICVVVRERSGAEPWAVLTGDTLFIGDVGRPDLLATAGASADDLARDLYRSLRHHILTLPDSTRVYPAHGAGSACGKGLSDAATSTIGDQRATNYALRPMSEDAFVAAVTEGQSVAPLYFAFAADANKHDHDLLDDREAPAPLDLHGLDRWVGAGAVVIDARAHDVFASGHLAGSINVGLDGRFAEYAGDAVRSSQPIVVVVDEGRDVEAKVRLARIGFDGVVGAVTNVEQILAEHPERAGRALRLGASEVAGWLADASVQVLDVRNPGERAEGTLPGATSIPLAQLLDRLHELDSTKRTVVYCAGGYRSSIAASLLRAHGFDEVLDIQGGFTAWRDAALPVVT